MPGQVDSVRLQILVDPTKVVIYFDDCNLCCHRISPVEQVSLTQNFTLARVVSQSVTHYGKCANKIFNRGKPHATASAIAVLPKEFCYNNNNNNRAITANIHILIEWKLQFPSFQDMNICTPAVEPPQFPSYQDINICCYCSIIISTSLH